MCNFLKKIPLTSPLPFRIFIENLIPISTNEQKTLKTLLQRLQKLLFKHKIQYECDPYKNTHIYKCIHVNWVSWRLCARSENWCVLLSPTKLQLINLDENQYQNEKKENKNGGTRITLNATQSQCVCQYGLNAFERNKGKNTSISTLASGRYTVTVQMVG